MEQTMHKMLIPCILAGLMIVALSGCLATTTTSHGADRVGNLWSRG